MMKRFIEGECRSQATLLPGRLDDWIAEDNPVRAVDAFVDGLDLGKPGFEAANNRDTNFTPHRLKARQRQLDESIARYLADPDRADRDPSLVPEERTEHLKEKLATVRARMKQLEALGTKDVKVLADRGYFSGEQILKCGQAGATPLVLKPLTNNSATSGRFDKRDFQYDAKRDRYRCPAGEYAT